MATHAVVVYESGNICICSTSLYDTLKLEKKFLKGSVKNFKKREID